MSQKGRKIRKFIILEKIARAESLVDAIANSVAGINVKTLVDKLVYVDTMVHRLALLQ